MGCASSREARLDCCLPRSPGAPLFRCHSMPHYSSTAAGPTNPYLVGPTSSFPLPGSNAKEYNNNNDENMMKSLHDKESVVNRAKAWSEMIDSRIPKPESDTINTWELMQGLEEPHIENISFSSNIVFKFDPEVISNFRKTLNEISPYNQSRLLRSPEPNTPQFRGIVKARISAFEHKIEAKKGKRAPHNSEKKEVIYLTSLRGVRKTFEDCWSTKVILQGYGVKVDERDVSIHGGFKEELHELGMKGKSLPKIFVNGKYLGGAEEVMRMHEAGELRGVLLEKCEVGKLGLMVGGWVGVKGGWVDVRFVVCEKCSGSCKVFVVQGEEENGLVRCPFYL